MNDFLPHVLDDGSEPETAQVEIRHMLATLRKRSAIVIAVVAAMAILGAFLAFSAGDRYEADAQILLKRPGATVQGADRASTDSDRALQNEVLFIKSSIVRDVVTKALGREERIRVAAGAGNDLVKLTATADEGPRAASIANAYANAYLQLRQQRLASEAAAIRGRIAETDLKLNELLTSTNPTVERTRLEADRQGFVNALRVVELAISGVGDTPEVVSPAEIPTSAVSRSPFLLIATLAVLGLLLGIGVAFAVQFLDRRILDQEDLERSVGVQSLSALHVRRTPMGAVDPYRLLRFQLFAPGEQHLRRLVALTPVDRSGASAVAAIKLASEFSLAGAEVLLVAADLGSSELALRLGLEDDHGLTTILAGEDSIDTAVQQVPDTAGVRAILAGSRLPGISLLSTKSGLELVSSTRAMADITLLETPPLVGASDAIDLAALADGTVLIVTHKTSSTIVDRAVANLRVSGANVISAILVPKPGRATKRPVSVTVTHIDSVKSPTDAAIVQSDALVRFEMPEYADDHDSELENLDDDSAAGGHAPSRSDGATTVANSREKSLPGTRDANVGGVASNRNSTGRTR